MKYYIIAGEASGDLHASNLVKEMRRKEPGSEFRGWGGDLMKEQGVDVVKHYRELAFMGFVEVIANLRTILSNIKKCKADITEYKPDAVILVDYPGFNLRIASFARAMGIKVFYYISPQVWAWKKSRVHQIKRDVDRMFVILPFEKDFYGKYDMDVEFVGHPLIDAIEQRRANNTNNEKEEATSGDQSDEKTIAILPGSRKQEISVMLPVMLKASESLPGFNYKIAGAPGIPDDYYKQITGESEVEIIKDNTYGLLQRSYAAMVTSGTATLETALFGVPEVVCYKGNALSYQIAKRLVKVDYISLVNLVMDRETVKELIQDEMNSENLADELMRITTDKSYREQLKSEFTELVGKLGGSGASGRTAEAILGIMNE